MNLSNEAGAGETNPERLRWHLLRHEASLSTVGIDIERRWP